MNDEVCVLRALVADPTVPTGPAPESPPLTTPRTTLPPDIVHTNSEAWLTTRTWKHVVNPRMSGPD